MFVTQRACATAYAGGEDAGAGDEESRLLRMFYAIRHACSSDIAFERAPVALGVPTGAYGVGSACAASACACAASNAISGQLGEIWPSLWHEWHVKDSKVHDSDSFCETFHQELLH